jgi:prepilin-type processing-associated H-X9-DG protein
VPKLTGVSVFHSEIKTKDIPDGTSHTFYAGEKYLNPDNYFTGNDYSDAESFFHGYNDDITRFPGFDTADASQPKRDRRGLFDPNGFGSAHAQGCNFVMCDGSVSSINYDIDPRTYSELGGRDHRKEVLDPAF